MSMLVVHNPNSGKTDSLSDMKQAFAAAGITPEFIAISSPQLKTRLHQATQQKDTVVAAGGDGTVNSVASMLHNTASKLGIIPVGTLNHFARELNIPLDIPGAVKVIAANNTKNIDAGIVNDHLFVNNSSIGWYPRSLRTRDEYGERIGKWPAAVLGFIKAAVRPRRYSVELLVDGAKHTYRTPFVFIGNNEYKRGEPLVGQRETLQGGQLAIYVIKAESIVGIVRMLFHALFTRKHRTPDFTVHMAVECTILARHHRKLNVACDGEVMSLSTPLRYRSERGSLKVIVP